MVGLRCEPCVSCERVDCFDIADARALIARLQPAVELAVTLAGEAAFVVEGPVDREQPLGPEHAPNAGDDKTTASTGRKPSASVRATTKPPML